MAVTTLHSASTTGRRNELHELLTPVYGWLSSGQHGLAYAVGTGGPAEILREEGVNGEGDASPQSGGDVDAESPRPRQRHGAIRVLRRVGDDPKWERAKVLLAGGELRDRKFGPWTLVPHALGDHAVAPASGGWVQWGALDIDAHCREGESELDARRRAKHVLGGVWRALGCSRTRHPLLFRSPGHGYHLWLPLTRGPASVNPEHTWPAEMVRRCIEWRLQQAGLELGLGDIEVFPAGRGLRAPCGRGMVLLEATEPDNPDALRLRPWPGTATTRVDWHARPDESDELALWSRRIVPTVRAFVEQWPRQQRTLADWLQWPELEWHPQWGCLGWRDGTSDIPRWREIFLGEKNSASLVQGSSTSQQSDDDLPAPMAGCFRSCGAGQGGAGGFTGTGAARSGSSTKETSPTPSPPSIRVPPEGVGGKLVYGQEFKEKATRLLQEGVTQPRTRYDAVFTLVFYWAATCGRPHHEVLEEIERWCGAHPHQGSRNHTNRPKLIKECLREARSYLRRKAPLWRFRGGGHAGGLGTLTPADQAVIDAVDPRVAREVGIVLAWLAARADRTGRVLDPVQIAHGLLKRLCGDRRIEWEGDGKRHRAATLALTELERIGVLTLDRNYCVGTSGRQWSCWYRFGSGELARTVTLPAAKWEEITPFRPPSLVPTPAMLEIVPDVPEGAPSAPVVELRVLGECALPEGLLHALSDGTRGVSRTLFTRGRGIDRPTADPAARAAWFERHPQMVPLTPRRLWAANAATVIEDRRQLSRADRLDLGGGGRDGGQVGALSRPAAASAQVGALSDRPPLGEVVPLRAAGTSATSALASDLVEERDTRDAARATPALSAVSAPVAAEPVAADTAPSSLRAELAREVGVAAVDALPSDVVDGRDALEAARATPASSAVSAPIAAEPVAADTAPSSLRAELAREVGVDAVEELPPDVADELARAWRGFRRGRGRDP